MKGLKRFFMLWLTALAGHDCRVLVGAISLKTIQAVFLRGRQTPLPKNWGNNKRPEFIAQDIYRRPLLQNQKNSLAAFMAG
jgi:hypothetical protein